MLLTEALPIRLSPEEVFIASVRHDMVNVCGYYLMAFFEAFHAPRMRA